MSQRKTLFLITGTCLLMMMAANAWAETPSPEDRERNALQLADSLKNGGDPERAAGIYQQLAQRDNGEVTAHIELATLYRKMGKADDAVSVMQQARARQPGNPLVLSQLGYAMIAAKKPEEAVNIFDELIAMQPENAMAYDGKAVAFDSAGNHFAAQEIYQKALSLAPDSQAIKNNLALSMILNDQTDEAITLLEKLTRQSNSTTVRQNLALAYGLKGNMKRARELNLQDVNPEEADENIRFYKHYAQLRKEHKSDDVDEQMQSSFSEPTEPVTLIGEKNTPVHSVAPSAGTHAKKSVKAPAKKQSVPPQEPDKKDDDDLFGKDATYSFPSPDKH